MQQIEIQIDGRQAGRVVGGAGVAEVAALLAGETEVFLVHDRNAAWVAGAVEAAVSAGAGSSAPAVIRGRRALTATEEGKDMSAVLDFCGWLLEAGASRQALLVAIGGGITTDLAGFAASVYKRGIRYANIPTTLLAQVDAGIGGKTGVNFDRYKNMLGVIVQPVFTFICAETLRTLPSRDFRSGAAEMLKTFLIEDRDDHYRRAVRLLAAGVPSPGAADAAEWQALVFAAAAVKAGIVGRDPFEHGERRKLNLGHTFAHAIEHRARLAGDDITHGEAVAMGIVLAARLADRLAAEAGGTPEMEARLRADFRAAGLPVECPYPLPDLAAAMEKDKKAEGGKVRFQLPMSVGQVTEAELTVEEALALLSGAPAPGAVR